MYIKKREWIVVLLTLVFLTSSTQAIVVEDSTFKNITRIGEDAGRFNYTFMDDDWFGYSLADIRDFNGDGIQDVAVGASGYGTYYTGGVFLLYLNTNGTVKDWDTITNETAGFGALLTNASQFGIGMDTLGDLDGDGVVDLAVGATLGDYVGPTILDAMGVVFILFMNANATVKNYTIIDNSTIDGNLNISGQFGSAIANVGDLDGDGVTDIAVGEFGSGDGAVWIINLYANGSVKNATKITEGSGGFTGNLDNSDLFGYDLAALGDLDEDGIGDLAVGAIRDDDGGANRGAVWILFLNANGTVKTHQKISDTEGNFTGTLVNGNGFGDGLSAVGDLNDDGIQDLIAGALYKGNNFYFIYLNQSGSSAGYKHFNITTTPFDQLPTSYNGTHINGTRLFPMEILNVSDIDGNGVNDLIFGDPGFNFRWEENRGSIFVIFMDGNSPPVLGNVTLNASDFPLNRSDADLTVYFDATDVDGTELDSELVKNITDWRLHNGSEFASIATLNIPFENTTTDVSATTKDYSTYNRNGTVLGAIFNATGGHDGGGAYEFNGSSSIVFNMSDTPFDTDNLSDYSFSIWVKMNGSSDNNQAIVSMRNSQNGFRAYYQNSSKGIRHGRFLNSSSKTEWFSQKNFDDGQWHHYLFTQERRSGMTMGTPCNNWLYYVDGQLTSEVCVVEGGNFLNVSGFNLTLGQDKFGGSEGIKNFTGYLDDFSLYNFALSQQQILEIYNTRSDLLVSEETKPGDIWQACVTLTDQINETSEQCANLTIRANNVPIVYNFYINGDDSVRNATKISNLTGNFNATLNNYSELGSSVESIGDFNNDSIPDVAVGATELAAGFGFYGFDDRGGRVFLLFLNTDGTVKDFAEIGNNTNGFPGILDTLDLFGLAIANLGDLDGDGVIDIAVGAPFDDDGGGYNRGAVYIIFLNSTGGVKNYTKISDTAGNFTGGLTNFTDFGSSVDRLGDLDGDGVIDIAVGAMGDGDAGNNAGALWVLFLQANGSVKSQQKITEGSGNFGGDLDAGDLFGTIANLGDLDGDGIIDLAVGSRGDDDGGSDRGAVYILLMNTNGTVKSTSKISDTEGNFTDSLDNDSYFGVSSSGISDLNDDGINDMVVGMLGAYLADNKSGALWLLYLNRSGGVKGQQKINTTTIPLSSIDLVGGEMGGMGVSVANISDIDGDNIEDIIVGHSMLNDGGTRRGAIVTLFMAEKTQSRNNLTAFSTINDTDGDNAQNIFNWRLNDTSTTVLYMPFERVNGTYRDNARDYSGNGNDGEEYHDHSWVENAGIGGSGAYVFNNSRANPLRIVVTNPVNLNFTGNFMLSAWINTISTGSEGADIISMSNNYGLRVLTDGNLSFFKNTGGGFTNLNTTNQNMLDGQWHFVAGLQNENGMFIYIDGALVTSNTNTSAVQHTHTIPNWVAPDYVSRTNHSELVIGGHGLSNGNNSAKANFFNGTIDEVIIFNRSLTARQITALYNHRTDLIVSQETFKNDIWKFCATPNDGLDDGAEVCSDNVTILNSPPAQAAPPFPSITITKGTTETYNLRTYFSDSDNDENYSIVQPNDSIANLVIDNFGMQLNITGVNLGSISTYINASDGEYEIRGGNFTVMVVSAPGSAESGGTVVTDATSSAPAPAPAPAPTPAPAPAPAVEEVATVKDVIDLIKTNSLVVEIKSSALSKTTAGTADASTDTSTDTSTETPATAKKTSTATESISTEPISTTETVTISLANNGDKTVILRPEIKEELFVLENEEKIITAFEEKITALASEQGITLAKEEVEKKVELFKLIERENVQPIFKKKSFSFMDYFRQGLITGSSVKENKRITYTGQHITGKLLESHLEDCDEIIILPGEMAEKTCTVRRGISARTAPLKITFKAFGEQVLERQVDPQESGIGAAVDVDKENQLLELYMLIPTIESGSEEFNDYFLEITINELFGEIYEGSKSSVLFADLYGPYEVRENKGFVFAQQLEYDPAVYFGNKIVKTKLLKNGKVVAEHEFNVDFGNAGGQLDLMFTNRLSFWALLLAVVLLVFVPGFVFLYLVRKHRLK